MPRSDTGSAKKERNKDTAVCHNFIGSQRNDTGYEDGHKKDGNYPSDVLFSFPFYRFGISFCHKNSPSNEEMSLK